jgi:RimJ/RimL family protein N-acetyltransferase
MKKDDIEFLKELWYNKEIMKFADEFPRKRGWSKRTETKKAWKIYNQKQEKFSSSYSQLILRLDDGRKIGESFFFPSYHKFGKWKKPIGKKTIMADIKLLPDYWGQGLGTKGMKQIVQYVFNSTDCQLFVVPPNESNPAAIRVYEKAGFTLNAEERWNLEMKRKHKIMELTLESFNNLYQQK